MTEQLTGYLRELNHSWHAPIQYEIVTEEGTLPLNDLIGTGIQLRFTGEKKCIACGRSVKKLYQNGYCFPCVTTLAECDLCIVKPHECHFHKGTCRDESFGQSHCMIPHYVYLAFSSDVKVGLTRKGREFRRWVDQGASAAVLLAETTTRKQAGELEMTLTAIMPDKTNWRKMLSVRDVSSEIVDTLSQTRRTALEFLASRQELAEVMPDREIHTFVYPRVDVEVALKSLSLDKEPVLEGRLVGIKGQYLLFPHGVFNVKKHAGMRVEMVTEESGTAEASATLL
ncbi:DUF2797 domain-containing protein [Alicyclobacillus sp. ALC3]|uniref:DUF2797 domain-containing protein n=1 Tax=Alicyclobacillus sp. ALC3 TaxID=2796143 RepID=UPI0023798E48|nr:DUF2797 domain-containing protein [Alicyclobacillus sp. ALC3]WDL97108.1 DUF2797 domain-containing protein [Alicyclobacillus sp. ALC3]